MKRPADTELALPSPPAESASASQSPSPSPEAESHPNGPPRKRSRTEITPEERREARAHRNRIAAQNSRDRRKAQFTHLERRVAELEEENRQLRAGMGLAELRHSEDSRMEERERDRARERENQELKERIKTLEAGWDAVVKALAASGLPLNLPSAPSASSSNTSSSSSSAPSTTPSSESHTTTFPVLVPPSPVFPITPAPSTPSTNTPLFDFDFDDFDPTRHLARVATTDAPLLSSVPQQRIQLDTDTTATPYPASIDIPSSEAPSSAVDESTMDDILREILAASPASASTPLPACAPATVPQERPPARPVAALPARQGWGDEAEMQRLLDMLPDVNDTPAGGFDFGLDNLDLGLDQNMGVDFPSALDLNMELGAWEPSALASAPAGSAVGVF